MSEANWPIRVGGEYSSKRGNSSIYRRVTAIDADTVYYMVCFRNGRSKDDFPGSIDIDNFRHLFTSEDQSPIPDLVAALKEAREGLRLSYQVCDYPANGNSLQDHALAIVEAALAKVEAAAPQAEEVTA